VSASAADLAELNRLGAVLERLGPDQISLSLAREDGRTFFYADICGPDGRWQCGMGGNFGEALSAAEAKLARADRGKAVAHA
jgi:hypothetical protein